MQPQVKVTKEVSLNLKLVETLRLLNKEVADLNAQIGLKQEKFSSLVSGVCLQEGLDFTKDGIYFSEDFAKINVYDLPNDATTKEDKVPENTKKAKIKQL